MVIGCGGWRLLRGNAVRLPLKRLGVECDVVVGADAVRNDSGARADRDEASSRFGGCRCRKQVLGEAAAMRSLTSRMGGCLLRVENVMEECDGEF